MDEYKNDIKNYVTCCEVCQQNKIYIMLYLKIRSFKCFY